MTGASPAVSGTPHPTPPRIEVPPGTWVKDQAHSLRLPSPYAMSLPDHSADAFADIAARVGLLIETVRTAAIGHEVYIQIVPVGGGGGPTPPRPLMWALVRLVPALRARTAAARSALESGLLDELADRWEAQWRPELEARLAELAGTDLRGCDDEGLLAELDRALAVARDGIHVHFTLFLPYLVGVHGLVAAGERLLGWDTARTLRLLTGTSQSSTEPTRAMEAVADQVRRDPAALAAVRHRAPGLQARLEGASPRLGRELREWVARWGHRCLDYEPAAPTIAEQPELVAQLLRGAVVAAETRTAAPAEELLDEARQQLSGPSLAELESALEQGRRMYPLREGNVHLTGTMPAAAIRRVLREVGRRLTGRGLLGAPDDVFWCHHDEVVSALRTAGGDLRGTVDRRRDEMAWVEQHPGPEHYGPPEGGPPDLSVLPEPARRVNAAMLWAVAQEFPEPSEVNAAAASGTDPEHGPEHDSGLRELRGLPAAPGQVTGPVRILTTDDDLDCVEPGDVVVCRIAATSWSVVLGIAGALVCDGGGALSHAAIVARELGIPAVLGTGVATGALRPGQRVTVDGDAGVVVTG